MIDTPAEAAADPVLQFAQAAGRTDELAAPRMWGDAQQRDAETVDANRLIRP